MRLRELREERNLSQQDVANAIKTSQTNIGRWEKKLNEPTANFLIQLANFFECSIDYLVGREDDFGNITIQNENTAPALTEQERLWLEKYRKLDYGNKLSVNGYIDAQLDYQEKHKNWKL
ncbi:MAG: helix-turn-helix transcriptional regulator [Clostridiales bacterium]|nr:helix-turn-helix transcriptional regulator [Clostridiales bacterium]